MVCRTERHDPAPAQRVGSGANDVWAVGLEIILRWDGQTWSVQP
jgi:hypothetical protein